MIRNPDAKARLLALLDWNVDMGIIDSIGEGPTRRYGADPLPAAAAAAPRGDGEGGGGRGRDRPAAAGAARASPAPGGGGGGGPADEIAGAREIAARCRDLAELERAVREFDGCRLRDTAMNPCFADGSPDAEVMFIGEAPGAEEDRQGRPFCGPSGRLLDRMLAAIGLDRSEVYITNVIYWRPPGNRTPTAAEVAVCSAFLERQIELLNPRLIVFVGGIAARALLGVKEGVTKLRGRGYEYRPPDGGRAIPAMVLFHPAYLLRQPAQKRLAWRDMLALKLQLERLREEEGRA
ncbi:MAG TPA: uracil-DNA glycosylase [Geminicoccaceae bacterium]|nr:uracil-DNA glycosylase [Geminicoccaceae bacterium]